MKCLESGIISSGRELIVQKPTISIAAYILAADTSKLVDSIKSYYSIVTKIIVSCDESSRGWTGTPIRTQDVIDIVKSIDMHDKCIIHYGDYSTSEFNINPMSGDTFQRNVALSLAAEYGDWILQIDTDEVVTDVAALQKWIQCADQNGYNALEWPLSVVYRKFGNKELTVCASDGSPLYEYPGSIAVRAGCPVVHARRVSSKLLRLTVVRDDKSKSLLNKIEDYETRLECLSHDQAIVHYSWSRSAAEIFEKVRSWGHANGLRSYAYVVFVWLMAPITYRFLRNIHPMSGPLWPRLKVLKPGGSCE